MASSSQHVTVGLDAESKRYMTRLTTAIDALAKAINNGEKVDKDSISEPVVQRLVEDREKLIAQQVHDAIFMGIAPGGHTGYAGRQTSDGQPLPDDESYYRDADGRLQRDRRLRP